MENITIEQLLQLNEQAKLLLDKMIIAHEIVENHKVLILLHKMD